MNNNEFIGNSDNKNVETYHATSNLNTAIENPEVNINNAVAVNIQNTPTEDSNSYINNGYNNSPSTINNNDVIDSAVTNFINNNNQNTNITNNNIENNTSSNYIPRDNEPKENSQNNIKYEPVSNNNNNNNTITYEPTKGEKKENNEKFKFVIPKELKVMLFIVFILIIFIASIPSIYDFFRDLGFIISG